jgi:hypothetical protein
MGETLMGHRIVRAALTTALPLILIYAFCETLFHEMRSAFRFAWLEAKENLEAYHREMRDLR